MLVAVDPGFGNVKLAVAGRQLVFPSVVAVAGPGLGMAAVGVGVARRPQEVVVEEVRYWVGERAEDWGPVVENLTFDRFTAPEGRALLAGALARAAVPEGEGLRLVVGLPVPYLRQATKAELRALRDALVGELAAVVDGQPRAWRVAAVTLAPQPLGAWADWALAPDGGWASAEACRAVVGIVDIGMHTVDLYGVRPGDRGASAEVVARLVGGGRNGVHRLLGLVAAGVPAAVADGQVRRGRLAVPEAARRAWVSEILGLVGRTWGEERPDVVLVAGGGAALLREEVGRLRRAVRADVLVPEQPVLANVRGLYRWAESAGV